MATLQVSAGSLSMGRHICRHESRKEEDRTDPNKLTCRHID